MADEKAPQEQTKQKQTKEAHPWEKYKVADEREGGLTIYNFREAE